MEIFKYMKVLLKILLLEFKVIICQENYCFGAIWLIFQCQIKTFYSSTSISNLILKNSLIEQDFSIKLLHRAKWSTIIGLSVFSNGLVKQFLRSQPSSFLIMLQGFVVVGAILTLAFHSKCACHTSRIIFN